MSKTKKARGLQLYNAARAGNIEELRRLVDRGVKVNATSCLVSVYVVHVQL
jgi:hypothetical protein